MHITTLVIGSHRYRLPLGTDTDQLIEDLSGAAGDGGRMVSVPATGGVTVIAFVTPHLPIILEQLEVSDDEMSDDHGPVHADHSDADYSF